MSILAIDLGQSKSVFVFGGALAIELEQLELLSKHVDAFDCKLRDWAKTDRCLQLVSTIPGVGTVPLGRPAQIRIEG